MTATEELRRMLDERGVEWERGLPTETIVREPIDALYVERPDGRMHVYFRSYLTPEQAIAATLGRGTCHITDNGPWGYPYVCSECGASFDADVNNGEFNYCPNCGARCVW